MAYDPFARGPSPVGVRSGRLVDPERDRRQLPLELWYPAAPESDGLDLAPASQDVFEAPPDQSPRRQSAVRDAAPADGRCPLIGFSHASGGHRRMSSFLCTHLASHGYVVAAVDHTGNTAADRARRLAADPAPTPAEMDVYVAQIIADRVPDLRFLLDQLLGGAAGDLAGRIDGQRIGLVGWSFGGWAALATPEVDRRVGAVVALAPAGNSRPLPGILPVQLTFAWQREVPTLYLVAAEDQATPMPGQRELYERTPSRRQMVVLDRAGHGHFGDEIAEGPPGPAESHLFTRGLALAHFDAVLKESSEAGAFLAGDLVAELARRGVEASAPY